MPDRARGGGACEGEEQGQEGEGGKRRGGKRGEGLGWRRIAGELKGGTGGNLVFC